MNSSDDFKKYLAGFFDGDGCIMIEKQKSGFTLRIKFAQSNEDWINSIQRRYPVLNKNIQHRSDEHRIEYELRAAGKKIEPLIDDLLQYSILKYEQLLEAKKYISLIDSINKTNEKELIYLKLKQLKKCSTLKPYERLNIPYIAGLVDSEGCIRIDSNVIVSITQKSDHEILKRIGILYNNFNNISNHSIIFYGEKAIQLLKDIQIYCIYKIPQINAALEYVNLESKDIFEKAKYKEIVTSEKHIDINKNNIKFKNQETHKMYIINAFNDFSEKSYDDLMYHNKYYELSDIKNMTKFEDKIFNLSNWNDFNIKPVLEFCESNHQHQLYMYYRKKVSSLSVTGTFGRQIRILVKDYYSSKYIGIMCLSSDVYSLDERDNYVKQLLKMDIYDKNFILKHILNLSTCVPLQPFGYNTNGGKLIASLAFSKEIFDYYLKKYKEPLLGIVTTSINGKSIQYDRLKCLKLIGYTKGYGSVNIPPELLDLCKEYNYIWKVISVSDRKDTMTFLNLLLSHLKLSKKILQHNKKRGIYFGCIFKNKLDMINTNYSINNSLMNISELNSIDMIYNNWKERWCDNRINNLITKNSIRNHLNLYNIKNDNLYINNQLIEYNKYKIPLIKEKIITDNLIKDILKCNMKQTDTLLFINKKYNINLNINEIQNICNGNTKPIIEDEEYKQLYEYKKQNKNIRIINITDEQIYFVLNYKKNNINESCSKIVSLLNERFNVSYSKAIISKIISGKIKPLKPEQLVKERPKKTVNEISENVLQKLSNDQIIEIIKYKSDIKTTEEVSNIIKNKYNVYISRNIISKIWNDELQLPDDITQTDEYNIMKNIKKKRTIKRKFTEDELMFIKNNNNLSLKEIQESFQEKYNKTITREYISNLIK